MLQDLRHALRFWSRSPWIAAVAVCTLALGIGATTTLFSFLDGIVLRPLPVPEAERLVFAQQVALENGSRYGVPFHNFAAWRDGSESFETLTAFRQGTVLLAEGGAEAAGSEARRVEAAEVSAGYFELVGSEVLLGRTFAPEEHRPGGEAVVVLSEDLWRSHFGGAESVLGRNLVIDGASRRVVGVVRAAYSNPRVGWAQLWQPLAVDEALLAAQKPVWGFTVMGRLAEGTALEPARQEMSALARRLEGQYPDFNRGWGVALEPVGAWMAADSRQALTFLFGVVLGVLAIACVNVVHLLLARLAARRREFGVRRALGASHGRVVRQLLIESSLLAAAGGAGGVALAYGGVHLLEARGPADLPRLADVVVDARVLLLAVAVSLAAALISGLLPALAALRIDPARAAKDDSGRSGARRGTSLRGSLVALEVALALAVVVASSLMLRSFTRLMAVDPGFRPEGLLTLKIELPTASLPEKATRIAALEDLLVRLEGLPGIEGAAAAGHGMPLGDTTSTFQFFIEGQPREPGQEVRSIARAVSADYFETLGIPLRAGRSFEAGTTWESRKEVLINENLAQRFWPAGGAVGSHLIFTNGEEGRIVGVTPNVAQHRLDLNAQSEVYVPWGSVPNQQLLLLRTAGDPLAPLGAVREVLRRQLPEAVIFDVATGPQIVAASNANRRFATSLLAAAALLSLALGTVGIYGVVAYAVGRRTREFGLRLALGARPSSLRRQIIATSLRPVLWGLAAGAFLCWTTARLYGHLFEDLLFRVEPGDLPTYALAATLLLTIAALASDLPARRAARTDPARALRQEG